MVHANKILPIVLVALLLISAVQAVQLNTLKEKLADGKIAAAPKAQSTAPAPTSTMTGNSGIDSLPTMVGGC